MYVCLKNGEGGTRLKTANKLTSVPAAKLLVLLSVVSSEKIN